MVAERLTLLVNVVDLRDAAHELHTAAAGGAPAYQDLARDLSAIASRLLDEHLAQLDPVTRNIVAATYRTELERTDGEP